MTQYLLSVHHDFDATAELDPAVIEQMVRDVDAFNTELQEQGHWVFAGGLHPPSTATVVRVDGGEVLTTDGPFAETKEAMGGFWIIEAADLDVALALATTAAKACGHAVELRPFQGEPED